MSHNMLRVLPEPQMSRYDLGSFTEGSGFDETEIKRKKRHQTSRACIVCRRAKTACGVERPCERCIRIGQPHLCVSHVPTLSTKRTAKARRSSRSAAPAPIPSSFSATSVVQSSLTVSQTSPSPSSSSIIPLSSSSSSLQSLDIIAHLHSYSSQSINSQSVPSLLQPLSLSVSTDTNSTFSPCQQSTGVSETQSSLSLAPSSTASPEPQKRDLSPLSAKTELYSDSDEEETVFQESTRQKVLARARFWSDSVCKVFSYLDSSVRKGHCDIQKLRGMAWIFYQIYSLAPSYRKAIDDAVAAAVRARFDKPNPSSVSSPPKPSSSSFSGSPPSAPIPLPLAPVSEAALPLSVDITSASAHSPSLSFAPALTALRDDPMSVFLTVMNRNNYLILDSREGLSLSRSHSAAAVLKKDLPVIALPKLALPLQDRMYGMLNSWRHHPEVQNCLSTYLHQQTPFDLKLNLMTERVRSSMLPFGVIVMPLYPAPFAQYKPWCNPSLALMLGYSHQEAVEKCQTIPGFRSFFTEESMDFYNTEQYSMVTHGKGSATMPFTMFTKDRRLLRTMLSASLKYQDMIPLYAVLYFQVVAPVGDMIVFNVAKN